MKNIILLVCLCFNLSIVNSQELTQDNSKTSVTFKIKNVGIYVSGSFSKVTVKSNFNKDGLVNSFLNATIAVKSLDTNNSSRNESLSEDEYFDTSNYEYITLKSIKIEKTSGNKYMLTGKLKVKATTKTVIIPLLITENGNEITIASDFEINRRDYNVGKGSWVMSDTVKIKVCYVAKK